MALGGTLKHLPQQLLDLVSNTPVFGVFRNTSHIDPVGTPDMLKLGLEALYAPVAGEPEHPVAQSGVLLRERPHRLGQSDSAHRQDGRCRAVAATVLSWKSTHRSCAPDRLEGDDVNEADLVIYGSHGDFIGGDGDASGPSYLSLPLPVLNHRAKVVSGIDSNNLFPMCIRKPADPEQAALADSFLKANPVGGAGGAIHSSFVRPSCSRGDSTGQNEKFLLSSTYRHTTMASRSTMTARNGRREARSTREMAVFVYLDQLLEQKRAGQGSSQL